MSPLQALQRDLTTVLGPVPGLSPEEAACRDRDAALFFGTGEDIDAARAVCESCGVRAPCLSFAVSTNQQFGVWGGLSSDERSALRRRMRRAGELS